jgi:hypothetical protein
MFLPSYQNHWITNATYHFIKYQLFNHSPPQTHCELFIDLEGGCVNHSHNQSNYINHHNNIYSKYYINIYVISIVNITIIINIII